MPSIQENYTDSQLEIISPAGQVTANFNADDGDYIRLTLLDENGNYDRQFFSNETITDANGNIVPQVGIYQGANGGIFLKPNEILDINGVPSGNYIIQFDFLRNSTNSDKFLQTGYFIKEISPSRKEVRLLDDTNIISDTNFENLDDFDYNWILGVAGGQNLSIVKTAIDNVSNPDSPSWILRLNRPLPDNITTLNKCFVAREVLSTQIQNIVYISSVSQVAVGGGLTPDTDFSYENTTIGGDIAQNKNELLVSASLSEDSLESILSSINNKDVNLNIDFNDYENHIHFGSAVKKLENFKTKVVEINDYLGNISASLSISGSHSGSLAQERKLLFEKVRDVQSNFTPYERFLYFDAQSQTTSSAPGIGTNYAKSYAMREVVGNSNVVGGNNNTSSLIPNYDGFNSVYNLNTQFIDDTKVQLFDDIYLAEQSPFFNYSGSIYLSFIMKSDAAPTSINTNKNYGTIDYLDDNANYNRAPLPEGVFSSEVIQMPGYGDSSNPSFATGSHYERYIFAASQSYWRSLQLQVSSGSYTNIDGITYGFDRAGDSNQFLSDPTKLDAGNAGSPYFDGTNVLKSGDYQVLSGSSLNSDYLLDDIPIVLKDGSGLYGNLLSPTVTDSEGNIVTNIYRSGSSFLPAGDLFALRFTSSTAYNELAENTASFITDIKVTMNSPSGTLPFSPIYHTGSNEWKDWYTGSLASASAYDEINIHSFEANLPDYIKRSEDYDDLKIFLAMIGEHFDLIRNYIDNQKNFYSKSYKNYNETGSKQSTIPNNVIPMIAENLGWEFINPYTGSLETYFNIVSEGGETLEEVKSETWRKVLNNLMYIYKTKGTVNSINALLNTYGYPHEALEISEIGGQSEHMNPTVISNEDNEKFLKNGGLFRATGSIHSVKKNRIFYSLNMTDTDTTPKSLHLDWWTNNAKADTIEFVFKSDNSGSSPQIILESSGSGPDSSVGTIDILTSTPSELAGTKIVLSSSDGTGKTYTFDATASYNSANTPIVGILNDTSSALIGLRLSESIAHISGHNGKIDVDEWQYFSASSDAYLMSGSSRLAVNEGGLLRLTQVTPDFDGDRTIVITQSILTTAVSASVSGFDSGSDHQILWDVRLMPSASSALTASLQFRLNNSFSGSDSIASNAFSMSTDYLPLTNGRLWNVMLQRETSSLSTNISQSYKLYTGLQNHNRIQHFSVTSMSVDGNSADGLGSQSNANFIGFGTLDESPGSASSNISGNLVVGRSLTGSIAEIRTWSGSLSSSKFKQHILNKFSIVGNTATASIDDIFYRFRLNENYGSASSDDNIIDANQNSPVNTPTNYTRDIGFPSASYDMERVFTVGLFPRLDSNRQKNQSKGLVNPQRTTIRNLNPIQRSVTTIYETDKFDSKPKRNITTKVELVKNINDKIDNYILENFSDVDLSDMIAHPNNYYSSSYSELDSFREKAFKGIKVDANKFIDNVADSFNDALIKNIKSILPAHSTINNVGVMIKPTILERNKYSHYKTEIFHGTGSGVGFYESNTFHFYYENSGSVSGSHNRDLYLFNMSESKYISQYDMKEPLYMGNKDSGSGVYNWTGSKYISTYNTIDNIYHGGGSGSYFHLMTGSKYISQYNMKEPLNMANKDSGSGVHNWTGSRYISTYNTIDNIYHGGGSGSYFNLTTGSEYFSMYEMITPLTLTGEDSGSSHYFFTGSKYFEQYNLIENVYFGGGSGSYFNLTTGSEFFSMYEMITPLTIRSENSGSSYYFFTGSKYFEQYDLIESIRNDGGSGSYFNLTTGSKYFPQYNMNRNLNFYWENTGSSDDYLINLSDSAYVKPYEENMITSSKSSGTGSNWGDVYLPNINTQVRDLSGLYNLDRKRRDGTQFGSGNSYIWDAWGTGSDDIQFLTGFVSESRAAFATDVLNVSGSHTASFTINIPQSNDGKGGQAYDITFKFVNDISGSVADKTVHILQSNVAASGSNTDALVRTNLVNAINGTTGSSVVKYGTDVTSSAGFVVSSSGIHGISASAGATNKVTLTSTERSKLSNDITLANVAGSVYDTGVTFSNGADRFLIDDNRGYYNKEFVFKLIGDIEELYENVVNVQGILSSSYSNKEYEYLGTRMNPIEDYSNLHTFRNKIIVDEGKGFQHKSYFPTGSDVNSVSETKFTDGRPMGRTLYFVTSSDGTILYPPNHHVIAKSSKQSLFNVIYGGAKGTVGIAFTGSKKGYYDPKGLDPTPEKDVSIVTVAGSNTEAGLFVVNRGGSKINQQSGSVGKIKR